MRKKRDGFIFINRPAGFRLQYRKHAVQRGQKRQKHGQHYPNRIGLVRKDGFCAQNKGSKTAKPGQKHGDGQVQVAEKSGPAALAKKVDHQ